MEQYCLKNSQDSTYKEQCGHSHPSRYQDYKINYSYYENVALAEGSKQTHQERHHVQ